MGAAFPRYVDSLVVQLFRMMNYAFLVRGLAATQARYSDTL